MSELSKLLRTITFVFSNIGGLLVDKLINELSGGKNKVH